MLFALGAVSTAFDLLETLTSKKASTTASTGFAEATAPAGGSAGTTATGTAQSGGATASGGLAAGTLNALFDAQGRQPAETSTAGRTGALKDLLSLIDGNGDGRISKSEFEEALGAGDTNLARADDVFARMDANGDGAVGADELARALGTRHKPHGPPFAALDDKGDPTRSDPLLQALDGAGAAASAATSSYTAVEHAIRREARALSGPSASSVSLNA